MKLVLVAFSFSRGGAGIAAQQFLRLGERFAEVVGFVAEKSVVSGVRVINPALMRAVVHYVQRVFSYVLVCLMKDGNPSKHSLNLFSSRQAIDGVRYSEVQGSVLNVHWINNDTLSLWALGRLPSGSVVTLHDEWLYCGAEHTYPIDDTPMKFSVEYPMRDNSISGINWNRWVWRKKLSQIGTRRDLIFTVPSRWMLRRARESRLLGDKDIRLLPNPIETNLFHPLSATERSKVRKKFGFDAADIVIGFGAVRGKSNVLKGFSLLAEALAMVCKQAEVEVVVRLRLLTFGSVSDGNGSVAGLPQVQLGLIDSTEGMRDVYGAADMLVVPSLVESFGQVAAESLACATPVVAFEAAGLTDIVQDGMSGYFAKPYEASSLAEGILKAVRLSPDERQAMGLRGRTYVEENFSSDVVCAKYQEILQDGAIRKCGYASSQESRRHGWAGQ